tara:strand:+ start:313 stop:1320 length:1008 start_codon:yes stop_codon:yes gene_type:complete
LDSDRKKTTKSARNAPARWVGVLFALMVTWGCSTERGPGELFGSQTEEGRLVLDALLIVDKPLPDILLSETIIPGQPVTDENSGVAGARIEVTENGTTYLYVGDPAQRSLYHPPDNPPVVQPETLYDIRVEAGGRLLTGSTITPPRLDIREGVLLDEETLEVARQFRTYKEGEEAVFSSPENQVIYQEGLLEARFDPIQAAGYQVGIFSLDPGSPFVISADFLDDDDFADFDRQESSPAFEAKDGNLRLPWFAVYFAGRHKIKVFAVDNNWFDFVRTSPEFGGDGGFGGNAGDNFKFPRFNLEGGIGVFGSASVDSLGFVVVPADSTNLRPSINP